jgi:hypothetical protein
MRSGLDFIISEEPVFLLSVSVLLVSSFLGAVAVAGGELGLVTPAPGFGLHNPCVVVGDCVTNSQCVEAQDSLIDLSQLLLSGSVYMKSDGMPFPVPDGLHGQGVGVSPSLHVNPFAKP